MPLSQSENGICTFEADFKFGLKCTESASNVRTFEANRTLPGKAVRAAVKSARLAQGSDALAW